MVVAVEPVEERACHLWEVGIQVEVEVECQLQHRVVGTPGEVAGVKSPAPRFPSAVASARGLQQSRTRAGQKVRWS